MLLVFDKMRNYTLTLKFCAESADYLFVNRSTVITDTETALEL